MKALALFVCLFVVIQVECNKIDCTCPQGRFSCDNCICIPEDLLCDGQDDCGNGNDEQDCGFVQPRCSHDQYTCWNQQCLRLDWVCDGDNDCGDDSDELMCPPKNCTEDEFRCNNGNCVLSKWRCDGDDDCRDGSDEHCAHSCSPHQFKCASDGMCIDKTWVCDNEFDCADKSDEQSCDTEMLLCGEHQFKCLHAQICIPIQLRCDGNNDCRDFEDEMGCVFNNQSHCKDSEFMCDQGMCINKQWRCDGQRDCEDFSDEHNCTYSDCQGDRFNCTSGLCIDRSLRCDGKDDCYDNSDEEGCSNEKCRPGQFHCNNGRCIGSQKVCNSRDDCGDGSDEFCRDLTARCDVDNGGCSHHCDQMTHGARCTCPHGYMLDTDRQTCVDFNECETGHACSQICHNNPGSYTCSCAAGYVLKPDGRGCKAVAGGDGSNEKAYLIFANRVDIRRVMPDMSEYTSILKGLENAIALDFHHEKGYVFWSDVTLDKIKRAYLNGSEIKEVVAYGLESPGGIAVDWIHNNLFWTDSGTSRVEVSDLEGNSRKVLIWEDLEKPRAIVAHPGQGSIFWTDWGSTPKIEKSSMDGSDRSVIANTSLFWPNGLTLDYAAEKLYWADAKHHVIECANLDGAQRKTIISQGLPHPFALTLFEDELYWTDWHTKSINKANKFTGNDVEIVRNRLHFPMDIHTFHPKRQPPARNRCGNNNGDCSHLCLPNKTGYSCSCPTGLQLSRDRKTCVGNIEKFLLVATRSDVRRITLDSPDQSDVVIPLSNTVSINAVDFDADNDTIYWSDTGAGTISSAKWNGTDEKVVVGSSLESPKGLAVDWGSRKLYWTDSERGFIEVANLDGTMRSVLIWSGLGTPMDIVVDPISGFMFWVDQKKPAKIERAGMDGRNKTVLVGGNLTYPNGLAIDYSGGTRLYWADSVNHNIESCKLDGRDRQVILSVTEPYPLGLTLYQDKIYWFGWSSSGIFVVKKRGGTSQKTLQNNLRQVMDIAVFHHHRHNISTECQNHNGMCSHLCLPAPLPRGHRCACPTGILLGPDHKTCNTGMKNFLIFARRTDIRKVSLDMDYFANVVLPVKEMRNAIALSVDTWEDKVYWTDTVLDKIMRSNLDGSQVEDVVKNGLDTPDGMAIDSIGRKIYWTDTGSKRIEVANLDGSMRKVLFWENLEKPRAIALHYKSGFIFWTDWGKSPRIERAEMDGSNRMQLITDGVVWTNGLAVDPQTSRIVWADARTENIETADFNGQDRRILVTNAIHPYGLTVAAEFVYWTDWQKKSIFRVNMSLNKTNDHELVLKKLPGLMDIHAVVEADRKGASVNRCGTNNGGCSHLCLPNRRGYSCACPTGIKLKDKFNCEDMPEEYILFASLGSIRRISLNLPDNTDVYLPLPDLQNVIAIEFDYRDKKLYYTDVQQDVIRRANLNGTEVETILSDELQTTDGLAVDWVARNLYWTDTGRDVIEVSWLNGMCRKTLISNNLDQPRAIALYPKKGLMYWTDWGNHPKIERAYLDGSNRKTIIASHLGFPNGLSIDYLSKRLYWNDGKLGKIETSDMNGGNRAALITEDIHHPFGLVVFGEDIYWTDWMKESIERADKRTGHNRVTVRNFMEPLMDIEVVSPRRQTGTNACAVRNGGCTHLCLATPTGRTCACPNTPDRTRPCVSVGGVNLPEETPTVTGSEDINECSKTDESLGLCTPRKSQTDTGTSKGTYIALGVVVLVVFGGLIIIIFVWKRQHKRRQYMDDFRSFTFTNPNYQRTSTETINSDRPPREWRIFRFNKKHERISVVSSNCTSEEKLNMSETEALYPLDSDTNGASSCFPDRHRSKNIFKPKSSEYNVNKPRVPYKPVNKRVT